MKKLILLPLLALVFSSCSIDIPHLKEGISKVEKVEKSQQKASLEGVSSDYRPPYFASILGSFEPLFRSAETFTNYLIRGPPEVYARHASIIPVIAGKSSSAAAGGDTDHLLLLNAGTFSATEQTAWTNLVASLKGDASGDLWALCDRIWPMIGNSSTEALLDGKTGSNSMTAVSSPTYASNTGFTFSGSNYLKTGFVPSTDGVQMTDTSGSIGIYSTTDYTPGSDHWLMGAETSIGTKNGHIHLDSIKRIYTYIYGNSITTGTVADSSGLWHSTIRSTTDREIYRNGVSVASSSTSNTQTRPEYEFYIAARNQTDTVYNKAAYTAIFSFACAGMTDTQAANFNTHVQAFKTALGR